MTRNDPEAGVSTPIEIPDEGDTVPTREYRTGPVTVRWYAERCIHSGNCVRALPKVFDFRRRPWVDVEAADASEIEQAITRCPSGALQFNRQDASAPEQPSAGSSETPRGSEVSR